ncbi:phytase [Capnocytophaga canimorsus]|uniref:3-phytase n=1 Tax=Capnocytophaga canimorsus TaxID=28188 RepID=A0AAD0EA99_9FLAO|nr:phytase [Capnocytophaga canimorsus]ATA93966.1 3-phytase [Capnocytophaga canimorsus]GJQ03788.1 3-phytase [Capnocytophaga canimorsus]
MKKTLFFVFSAMFISCNNQLAPVAADALLPVVITQKTPNDTDDPAIWIHPADPAQSLVLGTDKNEANGGLYLFDLKGNIVNKFVPLDRPNNVDVAYGMLWNGQKTDIAVVTERKKNQIRVFSLPDLQPIDGGGIPVFEGETLRDPMGIATYSDAENGKIYVIVGRKEGPSESYLWQYELTANELVTAYKVREFGKYSGKKEIEAIAVDNQLGYIYYCDETVGIRKYYADPKKGNQELALFATEGFKRDHEGIAIYHQTDTTGYILVSNQQKNTFMVYPREGIAGNPHQYPLLAQIPLSSIECDGADVTNIPLNEQFPQGMLVVMSNGKIFQYYDWQEIASKIK